MRALRNNRITDFELLNKQRQFPTNDPGLHKVYAAEFSNLTQRLTWLQKQDCTAAVFQSKTSDIYTKTEFSCLLSILPLLFLHIKITLKGFSD